MTDVQIGLSIGAVLLMLGMAVMISRGATASARSGAVTRSRNRDGTFAHTCEICGDQTLVSAESLHHLSSEEKALAVREQNAALGKELVEYVCRSCDASHCFALEDGRVVFMGVNLYEGQQYGTRCVECQRKLVAPPWSPGYYDGRVASAPGPRSGLGLSCEPCGAICCVDCCEDFTRNRTKDRSLLCPRCSRGPLTAFFHP
jgi:hypothetical protein